LATTVAGVLYMTFLLGPLLLLREFASVIQMFHTFGMEGNYLNNPIFLEGKTWGIFVIIIFFTIWICDSAAYFIGKAYGKNKLFQRVSPNKTWEGAIAGFVFAILSFYAFGYFFLPNLPSVHAIILGFIVGTAGQIGDLSESQLKRDAEVKDSSNIIPGHGGVLDRFDSIMFVSPVILIYLLLSNI
jgi:phosphatidate cytidylyltransferase